MKRPQTYAFEMCRDSWWKKLSIKIFLPSCLTLFPTLFLSLFLLATTSAEEQENSDLGKIETTSVPGMASSLEKILLKESQDTTLSTKQMQTLPSIGSAQLANAKYVELHPALLLRILMRTPYKVLMAAQSNECNFYALLETNLLETSLPEKNSVIVNLLDQKGKKTTGKLSTEVFIADVYKRKCFKNKEIAKYFTIETIPQLISTFNFKLPKTESECSAIFQEWLESTQTPYLCKISKILSSPSLLLKESNLSRKLATTLSEFQISYINNLCQNLDNQKQFCDNYLSSEYWNKILNGEREYAPLHYRCLEYSKNKNKLSASDYRKCILAFNSHEELCNDLGALNYPALYPRPNCLNISRALSHARLSNSQQDCPGVTNHNGITSAHRLLTHFTKSTFESSPQNCAAIPWLHFFSLITKGKNEKTWNYTLCYFNKIYSKEICYYFFPEGKNKTEVASKDLAANSESNTVAKIIIENLGAVENLKCEILNKKSYRPAMLKFKKGCFLLYNEKNCNGTYCPKEIFWDERNLTQQIKYKTGSLVRYFPTNTEDDQYAISNMIKGALALKEFAVRNITDLRFYFSDNPKNILHGVGCQEDLFPFFFQKTSMNQCHPIPFIADGLFEKNGVAYLVIRSALDDIHSPRILSWNHLYGAIRSYQSIHPQKLWTLYAIK
ncbi:MAG: hypothetical protein HQK50_01565 [Oligoflexia bacterium]|nr:hypothetical protein [Oligoflexia bacterium]MBF0364225.1 hypothetical protein [Oligoflexia bacterium]